MTSIEESPDCHRGLVRGCVTQMVKYAARGTVFASESLGLAYKVNLLAMPRSGLYFLSLSGQFPTPVLLLYHLWYA